MRLSDNSQATFVVFNEHYRQLLSCENVIIIIFYFRECWRTPCKPSTRRLHSESPTPLLVTRGSVLQGAHVRWSLRWDHAGPVLFGPQFPLCFAISPLRVHPDEEGGRSAEPVQLPDPHRSSHAVPAASVHIPATFPTGLYKQIRKEGCRLIPLRFSTCTPTFQRFATTILLKGGLSFPSLSLSLSLLFPFWRMVSSPEDSLLP